LGYHDANNYTLPGRADTPLLHTHPRIVSVPTQSLEAPSLAPGGFLQVSVCDACPPPIARQVHDYKRSVLSSLPDAAPVGRVVAVEADLSLPDWSDRLTAAGYSPTTPAVFLIEGLIGYLTEVWGGCWSVVCVGTGDRGGYLCVCVCVWSERAMCDVPCGSWPYLAPPTHVRVSM
jgi:hypothetical protein